MKKWSMRTREVAFLFNPAFCGRILYSMINTYNNKSNRSLPFPLIYLVLPLVLQTELCKKINSRCCFTKWIKDNQNLLINFSVYAKELVPITNDAIKFLLQMKKIIVTENGELKISSSKPLSKTTYVNKEISQCISKAEHIAKWFINSGTVELIYIGLVVKP